MLESLLPNTATMQRMLNRLVLAARFFRATRTTGMIQQVEFDFSYTDGDRSPNIKRIFGLWGQETDQPDVLKATPRTLPDRLPIGSHQRRAFVLGRFDARLKLTPRSDQEILVLLRVAPEVLQSPAGALLRGLVKSAYDLAYSMYPEWVPEAAVSPTRLA